MKKGLMIFILVIICVVMSSSLVLADGYCSNEHCAFDQFSCENNCGQCSDSSIYNKNSCLNPGSCDRTDGYGYTINSLNECENVVDCYTFGTTVGTDPVTGDRATNPWGQDIYDSYSCSNDGDCSDTHANGNHIGDQWTCENLGYVWTPVSNNVETGAGVWSITPGTWTPVSNNVEMNAGVWSITPGTWTPVINNVVANQGQWISSHGNTWADASWTFHTCGNWVEPNEQCDDTNSIDGDGCSSSCQLEDGFFCSRTWVSSLNGGAGAYKTVCSDAGQCGNGLDNVVLNIEDQWGNQITETKHCDDGGYCSDNAGECGTAAFPGVTNCGDPGTATCIAQSGDGCNSNCDSSRCSKLD